MWQVSIPTNPSWSWRKILQTREWCRGKFLTCIGNGKNTSLWHDYWLPQGQHLSDLLTPRQIASTGLHWQATVSAAISHGSWCFPNSPLHIQQIWRTINIPVHPNRNDTVVWTGSPTGKFTIHSAWEILRDKRPISASHCLLWYNGHIPRQSFILWLAMQRRLSTKDRLCFLEDSTTCNLCGSAMESHDHLFFQCHYSSSVWSSIANTAGIRWPSLPWSDLLLWTTNNLSEKKNLSHMVGRITLAAVVYHIWNERNNRIFKNLSKSASTLVDDITQLVRLHLSSIKLRHPLPADVIAKWGISPWADGE